jgi:hypothetical protein
MHGKLLVTLGFASLSQAALPANERVTYIPDVGDITDKGWEMYSGYAKVTATKQLHYVLITSKRNVQTDPL